MKKNKHNIVNGAKGFHPIYWEKNYADPASIDGVGNVREHANYLKYLFELDFFEVESICDFGFGMGLLFREMPATFLPKRAYGIEPSIYMFDIVNSKIKLRVTENINLKIESIDLLTWAKKRAKSQKVFDLGICTSVFQYLSDDEINAVLPMMAKKVKFLYFSAPTNRELDKQIKDLEFFDEYALRRSKTRYHKLLKKHFTFVSGRLLESKVHFDETNSPFTEFIFRF